MWTPLTVSEPCSATFPAFSNFIVVILSNLRCFPVPVKIQAIHMVLHDWWNMRAPISEFLCWREQWVCRTRFVLETTSSIQMSNEAGSCWTDKNGYHNFHFSVFWHSRLCVPDHPYFFINLRNTRLFSCNKCFLVIHVNPNSAENGLSNIAGYPF